MDHSAALRETGWEVRQRIRRGEWTRPTGGMAPGYVQANLAILPRDLEATLRAAGAMFNPWPAATLPPEARPAPDEALIRLVTSFQTTPDEIDAFAARLGRV